MILKVKILTEGCPQTNQKTERKSPDIQEGYYDETEGLHSDHNEDEISEEEFSAEFRGTRVRKSNDGTFEKVDHFSNRNM